MVFNNVLSLFDGIGVGRLALEELGWQGKYFASEIDKRAIALSSYHFPDIVQLGDIRELSGKDLPFIDLLMGGSPCTGFSQEGKKENFKDRQSYLFWEFVRLYRETCPRYFLLENVKMKKEWQDIISAYLGVEPININSRLFTCQNRERLYWTNIPINDLPNDKGETLRDIVDLRVPWEGKLVNKREKPIDPSKSNKIGDADILVSRERQRRVYHIDGKAPTLLSASNKYNRPKVSPDGENWRSLTIEECELLQGLDKGFTKQTKEKILSDSKRQNLVGNSWTMQVISYLISLI